MMVLSRQNADVAATCFSIPLTDWQTTRFTIHDGAQDGPLKGLTQFLLQID
jgi:hypothetical protein